MRKKYLSCLCLLIVTVVLTSCGFNAVKLVEDGTLDLDPAITIGDALNRYPFFDHTEWEQIEDAQGRTIVEFRGKFAFEKFANAESPVMGKITPEMLKPFLAQQRDAPITATCIAQFTLAKDGKHVQLSYSGFRASIINLKTGEQRSKDDADEDLLSFKAIYQGQPAPYILGLILTAQQQQ